MPKRIEGYQCDICGKMHSTMENAQICEDVHNERMKDAKIIGYNFQEKKLSFHRSVVSESIVPTRINVRFSDKHGDFGSYILDQYGFKGL